MEKFFAICNYKKEHSPYFSQYAKYHEWVGIVRNYTRICKFYFARKNIINDLTLFNAAFKSLVSITTSSCVSEPQGARFLSSHWTGFSIKDKDIKGNHVNTYTWFYNSNINKNQT